MRTELSRGENTHSSVVVLTEPFYMPLTKLPWKFILIAVTPKLCQFALLLFPIMLDNVLEKPPIFPKMLVTHTHTPTHTHTHNTYMTSIGMHEMHGQDLL